MKSGSSQGSEMNRLLNDGAHAAFVDIAHGEGMNTRAAHIQALNVINAAKPDDGHRSGLNGRGIAGKTRQLLRTVSDATRQGHSMDVAAWARLRSVHVGMRVDPDQAKLAVPLVEVARHARHRAHGH